MNAKDYLDLAAFIYRLAKVLSELAAWIENKGKEMMYESQDSE
jgi:hypothetical protein